MTDINSVCRKFNNGEEFENNESWTSDRSNVLHVTNINSNFTSYSSLTTLLYNKLEDDDLINAKLNNTIKKLLEIINNPLIQGDIGYNCYLFFKFLRYNGCNGFYLEHLHSIREILYYLCKKVEDITDYHDIFFTLLDLLKLPPLMHKSSELLMCAPKIQRHLNFLGNFLKDVPWIDTFLMVKTAIIALINSKDNKTRKNAVKPSLFREAVSDCDLPFIIVKFLEPASADTYLDILQLLLTILPLKPTITEKRMYETLELLLLVTIIRGRIVFVSDVHDYNFELRIMKDGIENILLEKLYSFLNDKKAKILEIKILNCTLEILWKLMMTLITTTESLENLDDIKPPSQLAMSCLHWILNQSLRPKTKSGDKLNFYTSIVNLILTNLIGQSYGCSKWSFVDSNIAEDLANIALKEVENGFLYVDGNQLELKRKTLLIVSLITELQPTVFLTLRKKNVMVRLLHFLKLCNKDNTSFLKVPKCWTLCNYVFNTLAYLVPKIPEEFIKGNGGKILSSYGAELVKLEFNPIHVIYFADMFCGISSINYDQLRCHLQSTLYVQPLIDLIDRILEYKALSTTNQKIICFLLITIQNVLENNFNVLNHNTTESINLHIVKSVVNLLHRCTHQNFDDSRLEQSYLITIACFIWKCIVGNHNKLNKFLETNGLFLFLDIMENTNVCIQNYYIGVLMDMCELKSCIAYLYTWRASNKKKNLLHILIHIWNEETKIFNVQIKNISTNLIEDFRLINDDQTLYLYYIKSICNTNTIITTATRPARPKIVFLITLLKDDEKDEGEISYWKTLFEDLNMSESCTILSILFYNKLKDIDINNQMLNALNDAKIQPLTNAHKSLRSMNPTISNYQTYLNTSKDQLIKSWLDEKILEEQEEYKIIGHSMLNPAFDALQEFMYITRTSNVNYKAKNKKKEKAMVEKSLMSLKKPDEQVEETYYFKTNVTAVFNQCLNVEGVARHSVMVLDNDLSLISSLTSIVSANASTCSLITSESDSSLLFKKYSFDDNGNII